ncbi:MAG: hypothetical protein KF884_10815 [Fimbriimonadaceae bacterium]|nr:hypothetical protein [Fimbriimonadaceae bacterium]QYK58038.1 MAG: hypothetical protein KF884_10815 [Fimbriimonadaceae bacterium]
MIPVLLDGKWVDPASGEILGEAVAESACLNEEEAERILERIQAAVIARDSAATRRATVAELRSARLAELERTDEALMALADRDANLSALEAAASQKVEFLAEAYREALREFAQRKLAGVKTRTWKTECGSVSLRRVSPRPTVVDHEAAAAWLEAKGHDEAIERRVKVTQIPADVVSEALLSDASGIWQEREREECDLKVAGTRL